MGGHKIIFELFNKGIMFFDTFIEACKGFTTLETSQRFRNTTAMVIDIFRVSHTILELFCFKNPTYQKALYKKINLITFQKAINLG